VQVCLLLRFVFLCLLSLSLTHKWTTVESKMKNIITFLFFGRVKSFLSTESSWVREKVGFCVVYNVTASTTTYSSFSGGRDRRNAEICLYNSLHRSPSQC
jgi:hypothetical protein